MYNLTYDEKTNTATFPSRSIGSIKCPVCGKPQLANRNSCYSCGCKFIFEDESESSQ